MLDCAQMRQPKVLQHELYLCCKVGTMFTHSHQVIKPVKNKPLSQRNAAVAI